MSLGERVRAARGVPQAVVKIMSFGRGAKGAQHYLRYISRDGELALETEQGDVLETKEEQHALVKEWSPLFASRARSRDVVHMAFSFPRGSDPEALRRAVRSVITGYFAGHRAAFAIHTDRPHPHAHVALTMKNARDGKKRRFRKAELQTLREVFAEAAREQGVPLAASSRAARGIGRKADKRVVRRMREQGVMPKHEQQARQEVLQEFEHGARTDRPWEKAMHTRNRLEREAYEREAYQVRQAAAKKPPQERDQDLQIAAELERFARTMPVPKTRRQELDEEFKTFMRSKRKSKKPGAPAQDQER